MFRDIHVGTLSPAFRQGVKERHVTNPTGTYGELALRNLARVPVLAAATAGLLASAGLLAQLHDNLYMNIVQSQPSSLNQALSFSLNYLVHNDLPAVGLAAMSAPAAVTTVVSAGWGVFRGVEFGISGVQTLNKMRISRNAGIADD